MVDVRGEQLEQFDPVYFLYYKGKRLQLGIISHFTNQGVTIMGRHWTMNLRGRTISSRVIGLTDDMITPSMETKIKRIKEQNNIP